VTYFIFFRGILLDNDGSRRGLLSGAWKVVLSHALASAVCPFSAANRGGIHVFAARIPEAVWILWRDRRPRRYGALFLDDVAGGLPRDCRRHIDPSGDCDFPGGVGSLGRDGRCLFHAARSKGLLAYRERRRVGCFVLLHFSISVYRGRGALELEEVSAAADSLRLEFPHFMEGNVARRDTVCQQQVGQTTKSHRLSHLLLRNRVLSRQVDSAQEMWPA